MTPYLRTVGHDVYTPTLTGLGERAHLASPAVNLDTHIQDVVNLLHYEDLTGVVLVGWSYGGMIVAGVADRAPERVAHVVYLDSDVPRDGDTSAPPSQHAARMELANAGGDGWRVQPAVTRLPVMLEELPEEQRRWITARLEPHLLKTWIQPIRLTGAGTEVPSTYVRCTLGYNPEDEDTRRQDERIRSEPTWRYRELPASHLAPWTASKALAELLGEVV